MERKVWRNSRVAHNVENQIAQTDHSRLLLRLTSLADQEESRSPDTQDLPDL